LTISNQGLVLAGSLDLGVQVGALGQVTLQDSTSQLTVSGQLTVADAVLGAVGLLVFVWRRRRSGLLSRAKK